eukprot:662106-Pelagomonas_calceolata.AAC.1
MVYKLEGKSMKSQESGDACSQHSAYSLVKAELQKQASFIFRGLTTRCFHLHGEDDCDISTTLLFPLSLPLHCTRAALSHHYKVHQQPAPSFKQPVCHPLASPAQHQ